MKSTDKLHLMSNPPLSASAPYEVENCRGIVRVFSDGSISRSDAPLVSAAAELADGGSIAWKDVLFDRLHNLHLRLYKPKAAAAADLPVVLYFHGGGFCIGSRTWPLFHNYCLRLCAEIPAVLVAPDYRLAPESRLPAAIDDCFNALKWIQDQKAAAESWLTDFDRVFIAGDSAGGNIAHNLAVRLDGGGEAGMRIRGFILLAPFFGGTVRTRSEVEGPTDSFLNLELIDSILSAYDAGASVHQTSPRHQGKEGTNSKAFIPLGVTKQGREAQGLGFMSANMGNPSHVRDMVPGSAGDSLCHVREELCRGEETGSVRDSGLRS